MMETIEETEWEYLAEGGSHVVFASTSIHNKWYQYVLKVPKLKAGHVGNAMLNFAFIQNTVQAWFAPCYLTNIHIMKLADITYQLLCAAAVARRELSRTQKEPSLLLSHIVFLEKNLTMLCQPRISTNQILQCITFELKVKCGLRSSSPFTTNALKLTTDKFTWMQQYKQLIYRKMGSFSKMPWGELRGVSIYFPRDMCSRNVSRVRKALTALMTCPQNNLKLSINAHHLYGWSKSKLSDKGSLYKVISEEQLDLLLDCLSVILSREPLLQLVEKLQCVDILDTEGTYVAYTRLLQLLPSDVLIDDYLEHQFASAFSSQQLVKWQHIANRVYAHSIASTSVTVASDEHEDDLVWQLAALRVDADLSLDERMAVHTRADKVLAAMNATELAEVLKMSMAAMIAKDASVIISLLRVNLSIDHLHIIRGMLVEEDSTLSSRQEEATILHMQEQHQLQLELQVVEQNGALSIISNGVTVFSIEYRMGIIDVCLKAIGKLVNNAEKEQSILDTLLAPISNHSFTSA
jgi:hypothetical protein